MKVFVYFNLHKKMFSVKALEGPDKGRVISHERYLVLSNATPKVSQKGRERVLRERVKNVHAGIIGEWPMHHEWDSSSPYYVNKIHYLTKGTGLSGTWEPLDPPITLPDRESRVYVGSVSYNPYCGDSFVCNDKPWEGSPFVVMSADTHKGVYAYA